MSDAILSNYLLFTMHGSYYAFELSDTTAVEEPSLLSPIPGSGKLFVGALNFHNSIVAVCNLATALSIPPLTKIGKIVVLNQKNAALAFQVESVVRIFSAKEIMQVTNSEHGLLKSYIEISEGKVALFNVPALIAYTENALSVPVGV